MILSPQDLVGKTIESFVFDSPSLENGGRSDVIVIVFTDGSRLSLTAEIIESPSRHWGDDAVIRFCAEKC